MDLFLVEIAELTDARAKLAGVLKKLRKASDPDDIDYYRHIAGEWRKYIEGLEKRHAQIGHIQGVDRAEG